MQFTIITVSFNSENSISKTIESVINQTYKNIEYIVIDGASTDSTLEIIKSYGNKINKIISEKDNGIYHALNKGISLASGEIIGFLHSDDVFSNQHVIEKYAHHFNLNQTDSVFSNLVYQTKTQKTIRLWKSGKYKHNNFLWGWMPPHPTFYVKKSIYDKFGVFDESFASAADYEIMLRFLHLNKISTSYMDDITVKMTIGGMSNKSLKNRIRANAEDLIAWKKNGLTPYWFTRYLKPLRKLKQYLILNG